MFDGVSLLYACPAWWDLALGSRWRRYPRYAFYTATIIPVRGWTTRHLYARFDAIPLNRPPFCCSTGNLNVHRRAQPTVVCLWGASAPARSAGERDVTARLDVGCTQLISRDSGWKDNQLERWQSKPRSQLLRERGRVAFQYRLLENRHGHFLGVLRMTIVWLRPCHRAPNLAFLAVGHPAGSPLSISRHRHHLTPS